MSGEVKAKGKAPVGGKKGGKKRKLDDVQIVTKALRRQNRERILRKLINPERYNKEKLRNQKRHLRTIRETKLERKLVKAQRNPRLYPGIKIQKKARSTLGPRPARLRGKGRLIKESLELQSLNEEIRQQTIAPKVKVVLPPAGKIKTPGQWLQYEEKHKRRAEKRVEKRVKPDTQEKKERKKKVKGEKKLKYTKERKQELKEALKKKKNEQYAEKKEERKKLHNERVEEIKRKKEGKKEGHKKRVEAAKAKKEAKKDVKKVKSPAVKVVKRKVRRSRLPPLRKSITPGTILIHVRPPHLGRRVIFLKRLPSGSLLCAGPRRLNRASLHRLNAKHVIATSTKIDIKSVSLKKLKEAELFKRTKNSRPITKTLLVEDKDKKVKKVNPLMAATKAIDKQLLPIIYKVPYLSKYLTARFTLGAHSYPHLLKF